MTPVIDTHLHFWNLDRFRRTGWLQDKPQIFRTVLPPHVKPEFDSFDMMQACTPSLSAAEKTVLFGGNVVTFYRIPG